jgi:hypothetical protein
MLTRSKRQLPNERNVFGMMLLLGSKEYERQSKGWLDAETFIQLRHAFNVKTKLLTRIRAKGMAASAQKPIKFTGISSSEIL